MKRLLAMLAFVAMGLVSAAAFALPSVTDVQAEVQKGNYAQAETLMRDVVAAKPGSAKAHYVYAEILAHNKRYEFALQEARLAKQLDPAIGFTQPEKFKSFEQLLEREQRGATAAGGSTTAGTAVQGQTTQATRAVEQRSSGIPGWIWGAGFAVIAVLLWRMFSARRAQTMSPPAYAGMPTGGYGPNYSPMGGGAGSGMLGTGLAAAGGFAAGMLAEKMLDGHRDGGSSSSASHASDGGLTPGYFDNGAADELSNRSVDFGSGGDWDSGGGGGGSDGGGSDGW